MKNAHLIAESETSRQASGATESTRQSKREQFEVDEGFIGSPSCKG
jgi:hypothetical protein